MKSSAFLSLLLPLALLPASAGTYLYNGPGYPVPDGNPYGAWSSVTVSGEQPVLAEIRVQLDVTSGFNGDLYAYLSFGNAQVPLLNRIGTSATNVFGASGTGLNVVLSDAAAQNVHAGGDGFLSGSFRPDGQSLSPLSAAGNFNPNGGPLTLGGTFAGVNPNGVWTLFVADVPSGGGNSLVNSWGLQIVTVPEPGTVALLGLGLVCALARSRSR